MRFNRVACFLKRSLPCSSLHSFNFLFCRGRFFRLFSAWRCSCWAISRRRLGGLWVNDLVQTALLCKSGCRRWCPCHGLWSRSGQWYQWQKLAFAADCTYISAFCRKHRGLNRSTKIRAKSGIHESEHPENIACRHLTNLLSQVWFAFCLFFPK